MDDVPSVDSSKTAAGEGNAMDDVPGVDSSNRYMCSCDPVRTSLAIQDDASALGFDWPDISGVFEKVREELGEIADAWAAGDREHAKRELGDLLFATVNLARFLDADPSTELDEANQRFTGRFTLLKYEAEREGLILKQCTLAELDVIWERVKRATREAPKEGA